MSYLADTDVIIDHLRGKQRLDKTKVLKGVAISIITLGELLYGAYKSVNKEKTLKTIFGFIESLSIKIINLDEKSIDQYAQYKAQLEETGNRLDDFDLLIASTAKINELVLLTRNIKHFLRIKNLKITDPPALAT